MQKWARIWPVPAPGLDGPTLTVLGTGRGLGSGNGGGQSQTLRTDPRLFARVRTQPNNRTGETGRRDDPDP